jgi:hypothetical protein
MGCAVDLVPQKIKRFLIGAVLKWADKNPLSGDMDEELIYEYHTNTSKTAELLLKKHGVWDVSHVINAKLQWEVHIELVYSTPNNREKSHHIDHHWFTFRGPIFPTQEVFRQERERFYLMKNLEHTMVPADNKNKGYYEITRFTATVIGV